jgi:hypothetical protein
MALFQIIINDNLENAKSWNFEDVLSDNLLLINDYSSVVAQKKNESEYLRSLSSDQILNFFDALAVHWLTDPKRSFLNKFSHIGIGFLLNFIRKPNLQALLNSSLNGNYKFLDGFQETAELSKKLVAIPQGAVTHWLAGNVPVLGFISLIQGILTKNTNILKLPAANALALPLMILEMSKFSVEKHGVLIDGKLIIDSCMFVYCDRNDTESQKQLSVNSNIRIAWGGKEAVESVMSLPRKFGTNDVIFGPKYSFAVFGNDSFGNNNIEELAERMALDASFFEQQGCNSPHTVFVEKGGDIAPEEFAKLLSVGMQKVLRRIPKALMDPSETFAVLNVRAEYSLTTKVYKSEAAEWTVVYSNEEGLADACYSRTVFVRPVDNVFDVIKLIEHNKHQSLGLCINESLKNEFAILAAAKGIERITEIGKMSVYDHPWDGMFPMNRLIRWCSLY